MNECTKELDTYSKDISIAQWDFEKYSLKTLTQGKTRIEI